MELRGLYGFKVGMSQIFDSSTKKVVPVTALKFKSWVVIQVMPAVAGGGAVLKIGLLKDRVLLAGSKENVVAWKNVTPGVLKAAMEKICVLTLPAGSDLARYAEGSSISFTDVPFKEGADVVVSGMSKGSGFQGVMKRHGFSGGPKSHGSNFHRTPGASGSIRSTGKIIKGRRMPGRMGNDRITVKGLEVVKIDAEAGCLFVKGAVPGKKNNLIFVRI
jgi:large subunit ribosomal protein L3